MAATTKQPTSLRKGQTIKVPVCELEFKVGGDTIWVHSPLGATVLRIKAKEGFLVQMCADNPVTHLDVYFESKLNICVGPDARNG